MSLFNKSFKENVGLHLIILLILCAFVIILQTKNVGFGPGHHGWVASHFHGLSHNATAENKFLGYALSVVNNRGEIDYVYFDRYPVFFSAIMGHLLSLAPPDLASQVWWGRALMNLLYCLMLFVSYFLFNAIFKKPLFSLLTTIIVFGSTNIAFYKDMLHYDQPALFGMLVLFLAITNYELNQKTKNIWPVLIAALFATTFGRGYSSFFVLGIWCLVRLFQHRRYIKEPAIWITFASLVFSSSMLGFNVYQEAQIRNVPIAETSIVQSASARLGVRAMGDPELERGARLSKSLHKQFERIFLNIVPAAFGDPQTFKKDTTTALRAYWGIPLVLIALPLLLYIFPRRLWLEYNKLPRHIKIYSITILTSGYVWCVFMRKLTAFHEYTGMYLIPTTLFLVFLVLKSYENQLNTTKKQLLLTGIISFVFLLSLARIGHIQNSDMDIRNRETADFQNILNTLPSERQKVYLPEGYRNLVDGVPYTMGFYLRGHQPSSSSNFASYAVTKDPEYLDKKTLTPDNHFFYLYKID